MTALSKAEDQYNKLASEKTKFTDMLQTQFNASECWNKMQSLEMNLLDRENIPDIDLKLSSHFRTKMLRP